jgi:hypothetical protein
MSIENFDNGSSKAAGFIVIGADAAASSAVGLGLVGMVRNGTGDVNLAWTEPIAEAEFHAVATLIATEGVIAATWLTPTSCQFQLADTGGAGVNGSFCFVIRRIQGGAGVPVEESPS